jgi:cellobiose dehydrogenase (acceptor)
MKPVSTWTKLAVCAAAFAALDLSVVAIDTYDVVIVGSGPGGLVAAEFLSRDPSINVLVLEAGAPSLQASGGTDVPSYAASKGFTKFDIPGEYTGSGSIFKPENAKYRVDWMSDEPSFLGKLVGGCSSINGALYFRPPDAYVNSTSWPFSAAQMNARLDAIEQMVGTTDSPSPDGKRYLQEAHDIVAQAFAQQGQYTEVTINDATARNNKHKTFGHAPFAIKNGLRDSPAKVFYSAFKNRANAKLVTFATVSYIKQTRGRATGVVYNGNVEVALSARGAVIMAAGAMSTPKVLIQSGIGPKSQLDMLSQRSDFPGVQQTKAAGGWVYNENVGKHLFDTNPVFASFSHPHMHTVVNPTTQSWAAQQYMSQNQSGVLATSGPVLIAYENYAVNGRAYEFQSTVIPNGFGDFGSRTDAFFLALYVNNPESRDYSSFTADGKWIGFTQKSLILSTANDVAAMKSYTKKVVDMLTASGATFLSANPGESTDAWVDRNKNFKTNHFGGSCYTSSDASDTQRCADEQLRVVGTSNIFVGDASLQKEGSMNPYAFIMYAGLEAANVVKSYIAQPPSPPQCSAATLEMNINYAGLDIGSAPSATPDGCCSLCQGLNGCQAFTWTSYNGGTCWLKSSKGAASSQAGSISGVVSIPNTTAPPASTCPTIEQGVDYVGNDIGNVVSPTADGCCAICRATTGCGAFSWNTYNGGTCWLKSGKGMTAAKQGTLSAVITSGCSAIQNNVDLPGGDLDSAQAPAAEACCALCRGHSGCKAFTWTSYNGGTCWLKSSVGQATASSGARSASVL